MEQQSLGNRFGSIWDTYECGERTRLENELANLYKAPDSLVVSSGMAAITCVLLDLMTNHNLYLSDEKTYGYFEINNLIESVFNKLFPMNPVNKKIKIIEPIVNEPGMTINLNNLTDLDETNALIIDNSLFSSSVPWPEWRKRARGKLFVIESLPKYLTHKVSGGVIIGEKDLLESLRQTARKIGVLLSRQASEKILNEDFKTHNRRLERLKDNADVFANKLRDIRPDLVVQTPHDLAAGAGLIRAKSSLVFVYYPNDQQLDREFSDWAKNTSRLLDNRPMVRAGYGWNKTYGRAYGNNQLNTSKGQKYLRFSIGLENKDIIEQMAVHLRRYPNDK
ncbi:PLP-dependent transferase [Oceanobacillus sp. 1P07AA]|uniref:PLP-dependent transferase n=1 Tax=Oceanobacillus sp. 1P07AA TaxID=3132293 RepID=UPI0039A72EB3